MIKNKRVRSILSAVLTLCLLLSCIPAPVYAADADCTHHSSHTADCGYVEAVEGMPCVHICGEDCVEGCIHGEHDDFCGYVAAVEGQPCAYHCHICHVQELVDALPEATGENAEAIMAQLTAIDEAKVSLSEEELAQVDFTRYNSAISALNALSGQPGAEVPDPVAEGNYTRETGEPNQVGSVYVSTAGNDMGVKYKINAAGRVSVRGFNGNNAAVSIPAAVTLDGSSYTVTAIDPDAFKNCSSLESISIADSVQTISNHAFYKCSGLISVTFPGNLETIANNAFFGCSSLTSVTIPGNVKTIGDSAFSGCSSLTGVTFPGNVKTIGDSAFSGCSSLTGVTFLGNVETIGSAAFYKCSGLTSVTFLGNVETIGSAAFYDCSSLTTVEYLGTTEPGIGDLPFLANVTVHVPAEYEGDTFCGLPVVKPTYAVTVTVQESTTYYTSLDEAIAYVSGLSGSDTVYMTLGEDCSSRAFTFPAKQLVLDLNGKTLTIESLRYSTGADVTVTDGEGDGCILVTSTHWIESGRKLTLEGGTIKATPGYGAGVYVEGTFVMSGGTIEATGNVSAGINVQSENAVIEISGGSIIGTDNGFSNPACSLNITLSGGTYYGGIMSGDDHHGEGPTLARVVADGYKLVDADGNDVELTGKYEVSKTVSVVCAHTKGNTSEATCTEKAVCSLCGSEYGEPLGHSEAADGDKAATCTQQAYCSRCQQSYGELADHSYGEDFKCTGCGADCPHEVYTGGYCDDCGKVATYGVYVFEDRGLAVPEGLVATHGQDLTFKLLNIASSKRDDYLVDFVGDSLPDAAWHYDPESGEITVYGQYVTRGIWVDGRAYVSITVDMAGGILTPEAENLYTVHNGVATAAGGFSRYGLPDIELGSYFQRDGFVLTALKDSQSEYAPDYAFDFTQDLELTLVWRCDGAHNYTNGTCTLCGADCPHESYTGGYCADCGKAATYNVWWQNNMGLLTGTVESFTYGQDYRAEVTIPENTHLRINGVYVDDGFSDEVPYTYENGVLTILADDLPAADIAIDDYHYVNVKFDANGGTITQEGEFPQEFIVDFAQDGSYLILTFDIGIEKVAHGFSSKFSANREGWTWTQKWMDAQGNVYDIGPYADVPLMADITLYAQWECNHPSDKVEYRDNGSGSHDGYCTQCGEPLGNYVERPHVYVAENPGKCDLCGHVCDHADSRHTTATDNGDTHSFTCSVCYLAVTGVAHDYTYNADTHSCICGDVKMFTVTWMADGEVVDTMNMPYGSVMMYSGPNVPEKDGHTGSWDREVGLVTENITVTAVYTPNTYYINWIADGEIYHSEAVKYGQTVTPPAYTAPEGYTFSGWDNVYFEGMTMPSFNLTITAILTVNQYTLSVDVYATGETLELTVPYGAKLLEVLAAAETEGKLPAEGAEIPYEKERQYGVFVVKAYYPIDGNELPDTMPADHLAVYQDARFVGWAATEENGANRWFYVTRSGEELAEGWHDIEENFDDLTGGARYYFERVNDYVGREMAVRVEGITEIDGKHYCFDDLGRFRETFTGVLEGICFEKGVEVATKPVDNGDGTHRIACADHEDCGTVFVEAENHTYVDGICECTYACGHEDNTNKPADNGDGTHSQTCSVCGKIFVDHERHSGGTATCGKGQVCACGVEYTEKLDHDYRWTGTAEAHWQVCARDGSHVTEPCSDALYHDYMRGDGGVIEVTQRCNCGYSGEFAEVTLSGTSFTYTGKAIEPHSIVYPDSWLGEKNIVPTYSDNVNVTDSATMKLGQYTLTFAITKADPKAEDFKLTLPEDLTYDGQQKIITVTPADGISGMGTITVICYHDGGDQEHFVEPVDVNEYIVSINVAEGDNYEGVTDLRLGTFEIIHAAAAVKTAPTANALTYKGVDQELVAVGEAKGGKLVYSLSKDGTYTGTIPTGTNAGEYTVWYYVQGDANHTDTEKTSVTVTIGKAELTVAAKDNTITYGDSPAANGITYSGFVSTDTEDMLSGELTYSYNYTQFGDVGSYVILPGGLTEENYKITFVPGTLTVEKKTITVKADAVSKTYGEADPTLTYKVEGLVNNDELIGELTRNEGENVGTYAITQGSLSAGDNYTITYTGTELTVTAKTITEADVALGGSLVYTGSELTQAITVADGITYEVSGNKATNVGTYELTVKGTGNYTGEVKLSWSIKAAAATVVSAPKANTLTYTGEDQTFVTAGTANGGKLVYSLSENGTYTGTIPTGTNAGEYTVWYYVQGDDNHADSAKASVKVIVAKAQAEITVATTPITVTYGEAVKLPDATSNFGTVSCDKTAAELVNAGTYTVIYTVEGTANYEGDRKTVTVTIEKLAVAEPTVTGTYTYTGTEQTAQLTGVESCMTVASGNKATNAGNYEVVITLDSNHKWADGSDGKVQWSIGKAEFGDVYVSPSGILTYNGKAQTPKVRTDADSEGDQTATFTYRLTENESYGEMPAFTDAGTYTVYFKASAPNHKDATGSFTVTVEKAKAEIAVNTDPIAVTYGETVVLPTATSNFGTVACDKSASDLVNAGTHTVTYTVAGTDNYDGDTKTVTVTINAKAITSDDVERNGSLTYNGKEQTQAITVADGITYAVSGDKATDAGNYELTVSGTGNYSGTITLDWEIAKAAVTITADDKVIYIGEDIPALTYKVSGLVDGDKLTENPTLTTSADGDQAGSYTITAANADAGNNYTINYVSGKLTIMDQETEVETRIQHTELTIVPDGLKDTEFNAVEKITNELISRILATASGYSAENMVHYDVTLQFSLDGGETWILATEENFPREGITVTLPYLKGTNAREYDFVVSHMFSVTSQRLGITAGDVEMPKVEETADGIRVTLNGLSPVTVAAKYHDHTGGTATCSDKAICTVCENAYGELDATNHAAGTEIRNAKAATCNAAGYTGDTWCKGCGEVLTEGTTIKATGNHTGGTATCDEKAICSVCGNPYGKLDAKNHTGGTEVKNAKDATCGATGYTGDTCCKGCGEVLTKGTAIKATGEHTYGNWKEVKEATKTAKGEKQRTCSVCGHVDSKEIPVLSDTPATGDDTNIFLWSMVMCISAVCLMGILASQKKRVFNR